MSVQLSHRRFTVDEYYRMAGAGILHEDDRVELIEGEIVEMPPIGSYHAGEVDWLAQLLVRRLAGHAIVRGQNPIHLSVYSEPQPDITLLRPRADFYTTSHPTPEDILLVIEVADTSVAYDREIKAPLYSRAGIIDVLVVVGYYHAQAHSLEALEVELPEGITSALTY